MKSCLLCGSHDNKNLIESVDYEYQTDALKHFVVRCDSCSHVFLSPTPNLSDIPKLYPETYYTLNKHSPLYLKGFVYRKKMQEDVKRFGRLTQDVSVHSVLDVGCGNAERLVLMREKMPNLVLAGLDINFNETTLKRASENNIRLLQFNVESDVQIGKNETYDLIWLSQVIEHLRNPFEVLKKLRSWLSPNGILLIETPSLAGWDFKLFRKKYWGGYHVPRHLHLFTSKTLVQSLEAQDFQILKKGFLPSPGFWIVSLRNSLGLNSIRRTTSVFEFLNFSNLAVVSFFTLIDLIRIFFKMETSNQYVVAQKIKSS